MTTIESERDLWLRRFHPVAAPQARLICFPHAGGSASFYRPLSAALPQEVLVVQYPGRQERHREPVVEDIGVLAERIAPLVPVDLPLVFFGHSMGAIVAFEVARRLDTAVQRLVVSGRRAPSTRRPERVHQLDDNGVVAELKALSGTDARVLGNEDLLRMVLPAIRGDYTAIETYAGEPEARVACPITVLVGADDQKTTLDEARAWAGHTTGEFDLRVFPGGHFYLVEHQAEVNAVLAASS